MLTKEESMGSRNAGTLAYATLLREARTNGDASASLLYIDYPVPHSFH
jgi:hypothetical protein